MPLLPLEPFVYPDGLLDPTAQSPDEGGCWWVLHSRPRAEKTIARRLLQREVGFFLPLYQHRRRSGGRILSSHLPLFPGYLFLHGNGQCRLAALETDQVVQCIRVEDQTQLRADLARVYQLMQSDEPLSPEERLEPGTPVEIISGPLAGVQGRVIRRGKQLTFFVEVRFLQRGASVEIDACSIRPLERHAVV